ncbi:C1-like, Zinc finger, RING/FYVE/PHD-type [Artemisia annua]|uniref:C1-like, Zinc finger, RING/FYVE/PHD-type n=1 Tax=Artemisia annua TaxID=35608 RepID=A0A2U1NM95_ARTAN|nr:C1-like, Zinc finger, RING/FYVE/PHD-type [Artemisia annua]
MGKLEGSSSINHFGHEHPLKLQNIQSSITSKPTCIACSRSVSGSSCYTCVPCNFYLHNRCSNIPRTLKHQSDQKHDLVLLSSPAYPEGVFYCNACGSHGKGFSYHCPDCQLDLHIVCASMPPSTNHSTHGHTLGLCLKPPYENQEFSCDICNQPGSNQWLYRCDSCEFDAHMKCATTITTSRSILPKSASLPHYPTNQNYSQQPQPPPAVPYYYQSAPAMGVPQYVQSPRQSGMINNLAGHAVQGLVSTVAQELIQSAFEFT